MIYDVCFIPWYIIIGCLQYKLLYNIDMSVTSINSTFVIDRFHLMNECHTDPRKFSCAVDCFIELSKGIFVSYLSCIDRSEFLEILNNACIQYNAAVRDGNNSVLHDIRETVWCYLRQYCYSFRANHIRGFPGYEAGSLHN